MPEYPGYVEIHAQDAASVDLLVRSGHCEYEPPPPADSRAAHRALDPVGPPAAVQFPTKVDRKGFPSRKPAKQA